MRVKASRLEGFTLLEVMIALVILAVGLLGIATAQIYAINRSAKSKHLTRAQHVAETTLEAFHSMPLASLPASGNDPNNPIDPDPNDGDATTFNRAWVVEPDTPVPGITRLTVNVTWVDENGNTQTTSIQSFKAP